MQCFLMSRDLMFSSQATSAAKAAGLESRTVASSEQIVCAEEHMVILDLTLPGLNIPETVAALKQNAKTIIIAVGPHVHEAKLSAANDAGCHAVLTKGQASRELAGVLKELALDG